MCDSCRERHTPEVRSGLLDNWERLAGQLLVIAVVLIAICCEHQAYTCLWAALITGLGGALLLWRVKAAQQCLRDNHECAEQPARNDVTMSSRK